MCGLLYLWFINLNFSEKITDNGLYLHLDATERQYKVRKLVLLALKSIFEFSFSTLPPNLTMYVMFDFSLLQFIIYMILFVNGCEWSELLVILNLDSEWLIQPSFLIWVV